MGLLKRQLVSLIFEEGERLEDGRYRIIVSAIPHLYLIKHSRTLDPMEYGQYKLLPMLRSMSDIVIDRD